MRWSAFVIAAYLLMVLQVGLAKHIAIGTRWGEVEPRFVLVLAVFVALAAPASTAVAACGILGLLLDLTSTYTVVRLDDLGAPLGHVGLTLIGPYTLGYMAGGYLVVQMRPMLFRQHPLTLATMMLIFGAAVILVVLGIFSIRRFYEPMEGFSAVSELCVRVLSLLYSAALGVAFAYPLTGLSRFFGFPSAKSMPRSHAR